MSPPSLAASCPPPTEPLPCLHRPSLPPPLSRPLRRIPQSVRILGSLVAILLVFLITAILVKVSLDPLPFFVITMIKIMLINCKRGGESFPCARPLPSDPQWAFLPQGVKVQRPKCSWTRAGSGMKKRE